MKYYLHVLVVLAIKTKIADANFHYTECNMNKLKQSIIWILTIGMSYKHTRVWIQDICKKSTILTKKYWENTQPQINIVINDRLTCNVNKVYMYMILVVSIYEFLIQWVYQFNHLKNK